MPLLHEFDERLTGLRYRLLNFRKEETDAHADVVVASRSIAADPGLQVPGIPPVLKDEVTEWVEGVNFSCGTPSPMEISKENQ